MTLAGFLIAFALIGLSLQIATLGVVALRSLNPNARKRLASATPEAITIVRPVSQDDTYLRLTLESTFNLNWPDVRILFCASQQDDAAVPVVRSLIAKYPEAHARLLIGNDDISQNPKLDNCVKGWRAAETDLVAIIDSNVLLPHDYVAQMLSVWTAGCGLVTSPPLGSHPETFWAEVECAFLNSHQARWQLIADELRIGFAQGKNLLFRKSILEPLGGIQSLAREPAEDAAATKILKSEGFTIRLAKVPFPQPLGRRSFAQVWARQVRWARLRRVTFLPFYLPECLVGTLLPAAALMLGTMLKGEQAVALTAAYLVVWYGIEFLFLAAAGWAHTLRTVPAMILRDILLPVVWVSGLIGNSFDWQGHAMTAKT